MYPLFLWARGGLTYYVPSNFSQKFSPPKPPAHCLQLQPTASLRPKVTAYRRTSNVEEQSELAARVAELSRAEPEEIMEITLDNVLPSVLCCYQEEYHRRLDRPEGTWKRVAVPTIAVSQLSPTITNYKGTT